MEAHTPRLGEVVVDQCIAVLSAYDALRADHEVGVHDIRVAFRRLRSTLTVFSRYVPGHTERLVERLRDAAASLSAARDLEVLRARVEARGGSAAELGELRRQQLGNQTELTELLASDELIDTLEAVRGLAQVTVREPTQSHVDRLLRRQLKRVLRRMDRAFDVPAGHRDEHLHALRKAVKRTRYVLEEFGTMPPDAETCEALAEAQDSLGRWQDAVVERAVTGRAPEAHSYTEWIALAHDLAALRDRVSASISIRSQS